MGERLKREGIYLYLGLIHVDMWQKPTQYCKVILQLKINLNLKKSRLQLYRTSVKTKISACDGFCTFYFSEEAFHLLKRNHCIPQ